MDPLILCVCWGAETRGPCAAGYLRRKGYDACYAGLAAGSMADQIDQNRIDGASAVVSVHPSVAEALRSRYDIYGLPGICLADF
ncbi:MAG: hypothetical protein ABH879_01860 [archaeon]